MADKTTTPTNDQAPARTEPLDRQKQFEQIIADALRDNALVEALQAFEMGEQEYIRAMTGSTVIQLHSGDTSNPEGNTNAHLDPDQS